MDSITSLPPIYNEYARLIASRVAELLREEPIISPEFLSPKQAANFTGFTPKALERMRQRGEGPIYFKAGNGRSIRYSAENLRAWVEAGRSGDAS